MSMVPAGCEEYKWLTNPKRKTSYATPSGEYKCDQSGQSSYTSSDWQGAGWYRISPSIGTKISTSPPKYKHCGTSANSWISGDSTPGLGQTIYSKVCFVGSNTNCWRNYNIKIRNCLMFILYYLPDTRGCHEGYCVE